LRAIFLNQNSVLLGVRGSLLHVTVI
jgi:hypothetical protein